MIDFVVKGTRKECYVIQLERRDGVTHRLYTNVIGTRNFCNREVQVMRANSK